MRRHGAALMVRPARLPWIPWLRGCHEMPLIDRLFIKRSSIFSMMVLEVERPASVKFAEYVLSLQRLKIVMCDLK